jgi:hypothetical protein
MGILSGLIRYMRSEKMYMFDYQIIIVIVVKS